MKKFIGSFFIFIFLPFFYAGSQSVEDLRKERENLLKEISNTSLLIEEKKESRLDNLRELNLIEREVSTRERLIGNFRQEIEQLDRQIEVNQMLVNDLESDIIDLKKEYSKLIRDSYQRKGNLNYLMFLFSAEDFSKGYLRYRLFKEYSRYRQKQGELLVQNQNKVSALLREIQQQKSEKEEVLNNIENELHRLTLNKKRKSRLVHRLMTEQQWLQQSLKEKEHAAAQLENKIRELIAAEKKENINAAESGEFADRMGKLNWPVTNGLIVNEFGEHRHPVLKNVTIKNNGIDIRVTGSSDVYCVHNGQVSTVVAIPGLNKAVIVRHGKYLTVYGNLIDVFVSKGDIVSAGQRIGKIYRDNSEMKEILHFEIWEENNKLDPEQWLIR
ncbi:murein hydrolase activator EnvC family protein [Marinilabilia salmonicolor]|uniref:murein hydrolase activator EnvC family protein n=1 Tax=Marinilabilia salmonicolor TaxID=989 RepID=UPI00029A26AE|nr:peptidoglycan DD-metalloendopeptidase family protein [Marinilabilia salmonicolor]